MHLLLLIFELVDDKTEVGVDFVVFFQALVHFVGLEFKGHYFLLAWCDVAFEFLNFEVQNVLELIKLLCLLFQD